VGRKGRDPPGMHGGVGHDVIYSERRGQSQKPEEIYQLIEQLVPHSEPHSFCIWYALLRLM
jgi:mRNA m6A methyltransferase catalytic subunit